MKVEITIRCNRCDAIETVQTEAWSQLKTSCGCNGPYRIIERRTLSEDAPPEAAGNGKDEAPAMTGSTGTEAAADGSAAPQSKTAENKD